MIQSRVYDIAASKGFMIAPYNKEIEAVFGDSIPMFKNADELKALYNQYLNDPKARAEKAEKAYKIAVSEYNADMFVQRMNVDVYKRQVLPPQVSACGDFFILSAADIKRTFYFYISGCMWAIKSFCFCTIIFLCRLLNFMVRIFSTVFRISDE